MKVVNIILTLALALIFCVVIEQSVQPRDKFTAYVMVWSIAGIFLLRQLPIFDWLWRNITIFFSVLLGFVVVNHVKKELKDWWNE